MLTSHPTIQSTHDPEAVAERRVRSPDQLVDLGMLGDGLPLEAGEALIGYADAYNLELSPAGADCYLLPVGEDWRIYIRWSGLHRICLGTGLWMPGRSVLREVAKDVYVEASCWIRADAQAAQWVECATFVAFNSHCDRDFDASPDPRDLRKAPPRDRWAVIPEIMLDEVGQYYAAAKAMGEIVTRHTYPYMYPRLLAVHEALAGQ